MLAMRSLRQLDPRSRHLTAGANAALVVGLLLWLFVRPEIKTGHAVLDALVGCLLGFSVTVNLRRVYVARRSGSC
jgi:type II secretory pathway component PulM